MLESKPQVKLVGEDGNVFNLIGLCLKAARRAGWTEEQKKAFTDEVTSTRSYDEALRVMMHHFDVE